MAKDRTEEAGTLHHLRDKEIVCLSLEVSKDITRNGTVDQVLLFTASQA
jgi:hypothetical protein